MECHWENWSLRTWGVLDAGWASYILPRCENSLDGLPSGDKSVERLDKQQETLKAWFCNMLGSICITKQATCCSLAAIGLGSSDIFIGDKPFHGTNVKSDGESIESQESAEVEWSTSWAGLLPTWPRIPTNEPIYNYKPLYLPLHCAY